MQYGRAAVDPPPGAREEWRIFVDLAIAMRKPLFGAKGMNGFIKATRALATADPQAGPRVHPAWLDRLLVATEPKGQRAQDQLARPDDQSARLVLGPREFGHFRDALRTDDKKVHAAPPRIRGPRRGNCSPNRIRTRRTAIRSSWRTGAIGTR